MTKKYNPDIGEMVEVILNSAWMDPIREPEIKAEMMRADVFAPRPRHTHPLNPGHMKRKGRR